MAAFQAKVAEDAVKLLKEAEEKKKQEEEEAERRKAEAEAQKKQAAVAELKAAVGEVRRLAGLEDAGGELMQPAKVRVAAAVKAATLAGVPQDDLVEASQAAVPAPQAPEPQALEKKEELVNGAVGELAEHGDREKKPKFNVSSLARYAARVAAMAAKESGKTAPEVAKAATAAAKAAGGGPDDISKAALIAVKIANNEELPPDLAGGESSSSSSSDSSSDTEREADISQKEKDKAKRDGIAAVFYFGLQGTR